MKTKTIIVAVLAVFFALGAWYWTSKNTAPTPAESADYKNGTYRIDGQQVTLINGRAEAAAVPGSATKIVTQYFGNEASGDLNADGVSDVAFLLTQDSGGSGTFYYVAAALKTADGYQGTETVLLGDRIAPQTTEIKDGKLIVNYADRAPGEPMTTQPSVGKSLYLKLDPVTFQFGIVIQDFEGEANPAQMTLDMQTWTWVKTQYNNDTFVVPKKTNAFTLTFAKDSTFSATTDCNSVGGDYTVAGNKLTFSKMRSTLMYCDGSQEGDFTKMLGTVGSYFFTSKGELIFDLMFDSGAMTFR